MVYYDYICIYSLFRQFRRFKIIATDRIALYVANPCTRASSDGVDVLDLGEWIHLKRGDGRLVESQEGLETKVGPSTDLVGAPGILRLFDNRALLWYLAGIDYEIPNLGSDDLVLGSRRYPWSPTVALTYSLTDTLFSSN
ncbi:hypothetical protein M9H77_18831 [Catharanthus roseus]|uniref:Uncharacterized protein n=1 Tax=Catharanthus roseus TaxID=4058 RepID=A0ACC0B8V0_CATRO|nr:hypothetical protein M9H77_18831 [Catharanthus roseus]